MYLELTRFKQDNYQTLGELTLYRTFNPVFTCKTLELPWRDNTPYKSRIPSGIYPVVKNISPKFGKSLWIQEVPNRTEILIHRGNFFYDILGCILVGEKYYDIDGDGHVDVTNSRKTINKLYDLVEGDIAIEILHRWK